MKLIRLPVCIALLFSLLLGAGASTGAQANAYDEAVKAYVAAASNEVQAVRQQVEAANKEAPPEVKNRYADFYAQLESCEKLLSDLRDAKPGDFDRIKARYEQQRTSLLKARAKAEAK